jgi:hypothetical protein
MPKKTTPKKSPGKNSPKKTTTPRASSNKRGRIEVEEGELELENTMDQSILESILATVQSSIDASLAKQTSELTLRIEEKNSQLLSNLSFVKEELQEAIVSNTKKIEDLTEQVEFYRKKSEENSKLIDDLKSDRMVTRLELNSKEQRLRGPSIRIHQYETPAVGMKVLNAVYKDFIKPAFKLAVKDQELDRVPSMVDCIEFGHKLRKFPGMSGPPSIIVRFRSRIFKNIFMMYKKFTIAAYNKGMNSGSPRGTPPTSPRSTPTGSPGHAVVDDVLTDQADLNSSFAAVAAKAPPQAGVVHWGRFNIVQ